MIWKVAQTFIDKVDFKVKVATLELEIMITVFENHRKSRIQILSGQKFIKKANNGQFGDFLKTLSFQPNSPTRQVTF